MTHLRTWTITALAIMALFLITGMAYASEDGAYYTEEKPLEISKEELIIEFARNSASLCEVLFDGELLGYMPEPWKMFTLDGDYYVRLAWSPSGMDFSLLSYDPERPDLDEKFWDSYMFPANEGVSTLTYRFKLDPTVTEAIDTAFAAATALIPDGSDSIELGYVEEAAVPTNCELWGSTHRTIQLFLAVNRTGIIPSTDKAFKSQLNRLRKDRDGYRDACEAMNE
jgi:hypothetical protein